MRVLRVGHRGTDVERWQEFLIAEGFLVKVADGLFDRETDRATQAFQNEARLFADGRVGDKTIAAARERGMRLLRRVHDDELTQSLIDESKRILKTHFRDPFDTEIPFSLAGKGYVARIERHYHPPGGARRPWGEHPGVSLFVHAETQSAEPLQDEDNSARVTDFQSTTGFQLSQRSRQRLEGVHPDLVRVVERASRTSSIEFLVLEGARSLERQRELLKKGASRTVNSRHLSGHAVDIAPLIEETPSWHWPHYHSLAWVIQHAALGENVPVIWGGDWTSFPDGPHWELPRDRYPA